MNFLYIDCLIKERQREAAKDCERRRLLTWNKKMKIFSGYEYNRKVPPSDLPSQIVETASAMFQAKGIDNTGVLDVCRSLGISTSQFYKHFRSLDEVLEIFLAR